jgi:hypothetical protein
MALTPKCRVCGAAVPSRLPLALLTWTLATVTVVMLLLIPTLLGFSTVAGGVAAVIGVFAGMLTLYLYLRLGESCQACRIDTE